LRILIAHNRYQQKGGEDTVVAAESGLLRSHGHEVNHLDIDNDHIQSTLTRITTSLGSFYSPHSHRLMQQAIQQHRPDIVHVHNFFPTFSPSVFYACAEASVPVVHTLHNYRMICASAMLFRDGHVCEECVSSRSPLPGIRHACYRSSHIGSAVVGLGSALHAHLGTWSDKVSAYIALTSFAADKLGSYRLPREKIFVKPNFTIDRGLGDGSGNYALFVGRLSPEKGIRTLIEADAAGGLYMDVVILGDGPMHDELRQAASRPGSRLIYKGFVEQSGIFDYMRSARVLLWPSLSYEGGSMVLIEALSFGLPVIGADLSHGASLIHHQETGLLFPASDHHALSATLAAYAQDPAAERHMRQRAREHYLTTYTPEMNYQRLIEIYQTR
jgi:glycosyltransferase involved in cell wall biosynthesis